jgi:hypothetical protein
MFSSKRVSAEYKTEYFPQVIQLGQPPGAYFKRPNIGFAAHCLLHLKK